MTVPSALHSATCSQHGDRHYQEDASLCDDALGLYAVADGMGASMSGRPAADLAIATLQESRSTEDPGGLVAAVSAANAAIWARTNPATVYWTDPNRGPRPDSHELMHWLGLGTTIVALRISGETATVAHAGDSRAYRWRDGQLEQLTIDHRLGEEARRAGLPEERIAELPRHVITRALGFSEQLEVEARTVDTRSGDIFLLASDGLTDNLTEPTISAMLRDHRGDLAALAGLLVGRAVAACPNSRCDNVTVVVIEVQVSRPARACGPGSRASAG